MHVTLDAKGRNASVTVGYIAWLGSLHLVNLSLVTNGGGVSFDFTPCYVIFLIVFSFIFESNLSF
jgi:hypothetical protein